VTALRTVVQAPARSPQTTPRWVGVAALATAAAGLGYAISFVLLADPLLASVFLLITGVLATPVFVAIGERLRSFDPVTATWASLLAIVGVLGSTVHGGYDLANLLNPPTSQTGGLPNAVDPRGLLTFGLAGLGTLVLGVIITRFRAFAPGLGILAMINGILLVGLYLGRLIILDATSPLILVPAVVTGFLLSPLLYAWFGVQLLSGRHRRSLS
jgi:hypothetical protein